MVLIGDFLEDAAKEDGDTSNELSETLFRNGNVLERLPVSLPIIAKAALPPVINLAGECLFLGVVVQGKSL